MQADGFYRDRNQKLLVPLIMYKRNSLEKNRNIGNKLDANKPHNIAIFSQKYSARNYYDRFSILNNTIPQVETQGVIIPDYVTINYECIIFTDYVEQMNNLVEAINFASDSYWGDPERFKFRARIDNFSTVTEINQGEDRAVKSTFNIILNGYIIPNTINKDLVNPSKNYSKSKIVFRTEVVTNNLNKNNRF